jgi:tetratricopeptide (TPR) repeat protein
LAVSLSASLGYSVPEVGQVLGEARAICDALGDVPGLYAVLINICNYEATAGDLEAAEAAARRCEEISEQTGLPAHRIQAQYMVAYVLYSKGELVEARRYLENSIQLYAEHDGGALTFFTPTNPLVESLSTLPIVLYALGEPALAAERAEELVRHARSLGRPYDLAYGLGFRSVYDAIAGNYDDVMRHSQEALALCEANGFATYRAVASTFQALAIGRLRSPTEGLALFEEALAEMKRLGVLRALGLFVGEAAVLQLMAGDLAAALATVDEALVLSDRSYRICLSRLHRLRAEILMRTPGSDKAEVSSALNQAIAIADAQGAKTFAAEAARLLKEGDPAPAEPAPAS